MDEDALTANGTGAAALAGDASGHIGGDGIVAIAQFFGGRGSFSGSDGFRIESGEHASDYIAGLVVSGPAAERGGPGFAIPYGDGSAGFDCCLLLDDAGGAVIFGNEFVVPGELDTNWLADGLRQQRCVVGDGIGGVNAIAAGAADEDDAHLVEGQTGEG